MSRGIHRRAKAWLVHCCRSEKYLLQVHDKITIEIESKDLKFLAKFAANCTSIETNNLKCVFLFCMSLFSLFHCSVAAAAAKSLQSCPTLCDPIDGSPPGPAIPGILQASTLEWVVISFSSAWKWKVKVKSLSHVWLLATPWTAHQAPPSVGFSRQEYWSGVPLPSLFHCSSMSILYFIKVMVSNKLEGARGSGPLSEPKTIYETLTYWLKPKS